MARKKRCHEEKIPGIMRREVGGIGGLRGHLGPSCLGFETQKQGCKPPDMIPAAPYTQAEILAFLQQTWTAQANVQFEVVQDWQLEEVDYDLNDDGALSTQSGSVEFTEIKSHATNPDASINIYVVQKMPHALATRASTGGVFIALENRDSQTTLLSQLAQEVGHELGIPETDDDPDDAGNVMSDPQIPGSTQVRKKDWRKANDPEN